MAKKDLPEPVGKCPLCTINLYGNEVTKLTKETAIKDDKGKEYLEITGKAMVFPCGIYREKQGRCPWETEAEQKELTKFRDFEKIAGLLGTMHTND